MKCNRENVSELRRRPSENSSTFTACFAAVDWQRDEDVLRSRQSQASTAAPGEEFWVRQRDGVWGELMAR